MFLPRFLAHDPARRALHIDDTWFTYGELRARGERIAGMLASQGVHPGDVVAIHLDNGLDLVDAHLGCMALGAIRLPLNAHYREAELRPIVEDASPVLVFTSAPERFPGLACFAPTDPRAELLWPSHDLTALLFTSGTTGRPKGVPQTFTMWEANLDALSQLWGLTAEDHLWLALPLFHTHGLVLGLHGTLLRGASARLEARFEPVPPPTGITHVYGVPTWYRRWLPGMQADPEPFTRLRLMVSGSDGLDLATSNAVFDATGHRILERYGMTETVMICSNPGEGERRAGTVGPPVPGVEVRLVDGEVQVRGPSVFGGYLEPGQPLRVAGRRCADTAAAAPAWFSTGDAGAWDHAGYLRIVGRKKELIIVGGVNVSPAEVEAVFADMPGVAEAGVCGLPDADLSEVVGLAVVLAPGAWEAAVRDAIIQRGQDLSGLKRPRRVICVPDLPRNALGKLQRSRLRRLFDEAKESDP